MRVLGLSSLALLSPKADVEGLGALRNVNQYSRPRPVAFAPPLRMRILPKATSGPSDSGQEVSRLVSTTNDLYQPIPHLPPTDIAAIKADESAVLQKAKDILVNPGTSHSVKTLVSLPSTTDLLEDAKKAQALAKLFNDQLTGLRATLAEIEMIAPSVSGKLGPIETNLGKLGKDTVEGTQDISTIIQDSQSIATGATGLVSDIAQEATAISQVISGSKKPGDLLDQLPSQIEKIEKEIVQVLGGKLALVQKVKDLFSKGSDILTDARTLAALLTVFFDHMLNRAQPAIDQAVANLQPALGHVANAVPAVTAAATDVITQHGPIVETIIQKAAGQ